MSIQLQDLLKNKREDLTSEIEFRDEIYLTLRFVSRARMQGLWTSCTTKKYDRNAKGRVPELDPKKFAVEFAKLAVVSWRGLTPKSLQNLIPGIDISSMSEDQKKEEITFSTDQLTLLVAESWELDQFIQNMAVDAQTFAPEFEEELGNSLPSQNGSSTVQTSPATSA